jgi:hypothetical protein
MRLLRKDPTCTTARITSRFTITIGPCAPTCTGCKELQLAFRQNWLQWLPKFAAIAALFRPTLNPSRIKPASDSALATVKTFCTNAPNFTPLMFTAATIITTTMPARLAVLTPISMFPSSIGPTGIAGTCAICQSQCVLETVGKKTPRNLPKATQTAAIVPVWMTRNSVHP